MQPVLRLYAIPLGFFDGEEEQAELDQVSTTCVVYIVRPTYILCACARQDEVDFEE